MLDVTTMPKINKKWISVIFVVFILVTSLIFILEVKFQTDKANSELLKNLQITNQELDNLKDNYTNLLKILGLNSNGGSSIPIQTRLGIKLMQGIRYPNYLWVTGEVENTANITLYNVRLRFTLHTTNGTDVYEDIIGTMRGHETVNRRFTVYTSLGTILSWNLEPVATYEP